MKKSFSFLFVLLITASAFAQYGVKSQTPFPGSTSSAPKALGSVVLDGTNLYGYNFFPGTFVTVDLPGYNNLAVVNSFSNPIGGVDFDNEGNLYCIGTSSNVLYKEDFETGTVTSLGTITGLPSSSHTGLAYDNQSGTMYCLQILWGTSGNLYTIDLTTLTATFVGAITGMTNGLALAFNSKDGMLYAFNFQPSQSQLLKINPKTAAATVVGSTSSFLNYTDGYFGDCEFNDLTGELIFSTYDDGTTSTTIWSIDASNCNATAKATIPNVQLVLSINTASKPVPLKWYYFILVFLIPMGIVIRKRFF
jgi:hypothetical protein